MSLWLILLIALMLGLGGWLMHADQSSKGRPT